MSLIGVKKRKDRGEIAKGFLPGVMQIFQNEIVVMLAELCEYTKQ